MYLGRDTADPRYIQREVMISGDTTRSENKNITLTIMDRNCRSRNTSDREGHIERKNTLKSRQFISIYIDKSHCHSHSWSSDAEIRLWDNLDLRDTHTRECHIFFDIILEGKMQSHRTISTRSISKNNLTFNGIDIYISHLFHILIEKYSSLDRSMYRMKLWGNCIFILVLEYESSC